MTTTTPPDKLPTHSSDTRWTRYRARFGEGPMVVVFMVAYVAVIAFSVQYGGWDDQYVPVGVAGIAGAIAGVLLAKAYVSDAFAQFASVILGVIVVGALLLMNVDMFGERLVDRIKPFAEFVADWYLGRQESSDQQYVLVSFLLGMLVWMFGFLSTWSLFRRGWLAAGLLLPAVLALINLHYAPTGYPWTIGLLLALAIPIAARMYFYQRELRWARRRMAAPVGLGNRFLIVGTAIGLLITAFSAQTPSAWSYPTFQPLMKGIGERYIEASDQASRWLDDVRHGEGREIVQAGSYTAFDDAFSIGGPLDLSDQPEVMVQSNASRAPYLTAHTYDEYTGRGWASSTDTQFGDVETDQGRLAPELLFREGQEVVLSDAATGARVAQTTTITPLGGPPGVVFSVDTYLTADIQTVVRMSWQQLADVPFAVTTDTLNALPPDIQKIGNLLLQAELSGQASDWGPEATSASMQQGIEEEVDSLADRGVLVRWDATPEGIVQNVYVTGRIPIFDDVEAVFPRKSDDASAGSTYRVRSLTSIATPDQLATAPTTYPEWVTARYLQTGDTVTDRTTNLAIEVVGDASDPYTQAVRIEAFLRNHITYDERVEAPPDDADLVDFVLFENQRGYCEHYSAAMTVMMRSLGVPARTVVGYYPGQYDEGEGAFIYRQLNAHAWTEVFFPGYGWIPFEPTANRPLEERESPVAPEETQQPVPTEAVPTPDVADQNTQSTPVPENRTFENPGPPEQVVMDGNADGGIPGRVMPVAGVLLASAVVSAAVWLVWSWTLRGLSPIASLFARVQRIGRVGGVRSGPSTTPREYANRFSQEMPAMGGPVRKIVQVYETDQYGPSGADAGSLAGARVAWQELRRMAMRQLVRIRKRRDKRSTTREIG